ncbi:uncharacterized protein LOC113324879 [Papaver somniferum]|uniref:uncharacterized protein LOC113324879 n=1 Tax=Papaver somniferum TaxID=3469 RepID=UPI000E6FD443|nr:uncharacterized protein LOC113324879 [Papaver somniferum]
MSKKFMADNRFVVPYNPWLLHKYDCHINVEVCSSVQSVKYLYKYVYKGPDRIFFRVQRVRPEFENDMVTRYINARWVCAQEAMWRIYRFAMNKMCPAFQRLHLHMPKKNSVMLYEHQTVNEVLENENNSKTTLTEYFVTNACDPTARQWLYREFPEHYKWDKATMKWQKRRTKQRVIARVYFVPPTAVERFVDRKQFRIFKTAAGARGLLENDNSLRACMAEAATNKMPSALRTLFGSILVFFNSMDTRKLWEEFFNDMVEDYASSSDTSSAYLSDHLLRELGQMLHQHGKRLKDYDLPAIVGILDDNLQMSDLIEEEVSIPVSEKDMMNVDKLNEDQSKAYDAIMGAVRRKESRVFFVDGPGGTRKTFLYRAILSTVRRNGGIVIATTTSGVTATMLHGGRTAHSRFKLPFTPATSTCDIAKNDKLADLLLQATVIMWYEATMAHRYSVEAFDTAMRDITCNEKPFGGKIFIMGGDFRQVLPVVPKASRGKMVDSCLTRSSLWRHVEVLRLNKNMRAVGDTSYSDFLMRVGDGNEPSLPNDMIKMPDDMVIPWNGEDSVSQLIDVTFPDLADNSKDQDYLLNRALITPLNEHVDKLNDRVVSMFLGEEHMYYSFDSVEMISKTSIFKNT